MRDEAKEAAMTAFTPGMLFMTAIALNFGSVPAWHRAKSAARLARRRRKMAKARLNPLSDRQKKELLDSIRNDDWHE